MDVTTELPQVAALALNSVTSTVLRNSISETLGRCRFIVNYISKIHLPQDEVNEGSQLDVSTETRISEQFLELVTLVQGLLKQLESAYPHETEEDTDFDEDAWDLEFDLVDTERKEVKKEEEKSAEPIDKQIGDLTWALGSMLSSKLDEFAGRIEFALQGNDPWILWAELDDYTHKILKGILALYFSILGLFSQAGRGELLPEYTSSVQTSIDLRRDVAELTTHIDRFNSAIAKRSGADCLPYVVALSDRLSRFSQRPAYRNLRTPDKKEFINFRRQLFTIRHSGSGLNTNHLRLSVEGFSKFLESLHAINQREILILHDKQILQEIQTVYLPNLLRLFQDDEAAAAAGFAPIMKNLATIYGRDPELDKLLDNFEDNPQKVYSGAEGFSLLQEIHRISRSMLKTLG